MVSFDLFFSYRTFTQCIIVGFLNLLLLIVINLCSLGEMDITGLSIVCHCSTKDDARSNKAFNAFL